MKCNFCEKILTNKHLCAKMYCYEYIFKQLFMNTLLDFKPIDIEEFYDICLRVIRSDRLSNDVPNPYDIMRICLEEFISEYECF